MGTQNAYGLLQSVTFQRPPPPHPGHLHTVASVSASLWSSCGTQSLRHDCLNGPNVDVAMTIFRDTSGHCFATSLYCPHLSPCDFSIPTAQRTKVKSPLRFSQSALEHFGHRLYFGICMSRWLKQTTWDMSYHSPYRPSYEAVTSWMPGKQFISPGNSRTAVTPIIPVIILLSVQFWIL
jgi:hypothetical protein